MLQVKNIKKEYRTGDLVQKALDGVSLNLRDNEFVAILGPSGSGKTTLLNIIGGLDRYDSGDLVINGVSTRKYKDRDWDSYRNHTIGFVFQSYNLIMHQSVLSNVELALTISGISGAERRERAVKALEKVGLGEQLHKKPNQMSGGQMQRVAIARALVNDPDIVLADEPTGALDSETSVQVMELLKEVAKDRLVVMVTHNPELAESYATRIITIKDGHKIGDTDPYEIDETAIAPPVHKNLGRASMSFLTALSLSFNNLRTKKARTFMVSFAGSIGIIGIALILALSSGVNQYIEAQEATTLSEYPLEIEQTGYDLTSFMTNSGSGMMMSGSGSSERNEDRVGVMEIADTMFDGVSNNDLSSLKEYLESGESDIYDYVKSIEYTYDITPQIFMINEDDGEETVSQLNPNTMFSSLVTGNIGVSNMMGTMMGSSIFSQLPEEASLYEDSYDVKAGHWPENSHEIVLILSSSGNVSDILLYQMGIKDRDELETMVKEFAESSGTTFNADADETEDEEAEDTAVVTDAETAAEQEDSDQEYYSYDEFLGQNFKLVNNSDYFVYDSEYEVWTDRSDNDAYVEQLAKDGEDLTIVGIVQPKEDAEVTNLTPGLAYTSDLIPDIIETAADSDVVKAQLADPDTNIFTGNEFGADDDEDSFDLSKLFSVDEDAIADAFSVDTGDSDLSSLADALSGNTDFSNLDLGSIDFSNMNLGNMIDANSLANIFPSGDASIADALKGIKIELTDDAAEQLTSLLSNLMSGYQSYALANNLPTAENLGTDIGSYLGSETARTVIREQIEAIINENRDTIISSDQVTDLIVEIFSGYVPYLESTYPDQQITTAMLTEHFREYLDASGSQSKIDTLISGVSTSVANIFSEDSIRKITSALAASYSSEAAAGQYTDPAAVVSGFTAYISTSDAQQLIMDSAGKIIKTDELQQSVSKTVSGLLGSVAQNLGNQLGNSIQAIMTQVMKQLQSTLTDAMTNMMGSLGSDLGSMFDINPDAFAEAITTNFDAGQIQELMSSMLSGTEDSYEGNLSKLGYADLNDPITISIYSKNFDAKNEVVNIIDNYNEMVADAGEDSKVITYTDIVSTMMSSVTDIINAISYVLIAFVGISLVVSSIMIGVITYISVLERRKEIGILRAIGASKNNVAQVFNAETFITGLLAGTIGIVVSEILIVPINIIIRTVTNQDGIRAVLPIRYALILILLSVVLTMIAGLLPSRKASKSDPVTALRTE